MNRKSKGRFIVFLLILFISIGFAVLSSNLNILGTTSINKQKWDVHFENPTKVGGNVEATELNLDGDTTVNFRVDLNKPTDTYEFTIDVVNNGTINAMIKSITSTELTDEQKKLFEYVITYDDGASLKEKQVLRAGESYKYKVTIRYKDDIQESDLSINDQTVEIEFHVEYVQADDTWIEKVNNSFVSVYNQATPGMLVQGDEVNIGNEHFYIVNYGEDKVILLAKYLLNVGSRKDPTSVENIQAKNVRPFKRGSKNYGTVAFSKLDYWYDGNVFNSSYGEEVNNNNVYDESKDAPSGDNYSVAYYVKQYVSYLNSIGAISIKGRLLTYNDVDRYFELPSEGSIMLPISVSTWLYSTDYWVSSVKKEVDNWGDVYIINHNRAFYRIGHSYDSPDGVGLRPVIEISREYL